MNISGRIITGCVLLALAWPGVAHAASPAGSGAFSAMAAVGQDSGGGGLARFLPGFGGNGQPRVDPFAVEGAPSMPPVAAPAPPAPPIAAPPPAAPPAPAGGSVLRLPPTSTQGARPINPNVKAQSDHLLLQARQALSGGDTRTARKYAQQAASLGVRYADREDSPQNVEATIAKFESLARLKATSGTSAAYLSQYGQVLLEQGEWMLRWRQYDAAEQLARDAAKLRVNYNPYEANPKGLLSRIADARQAGARFKGPAPGRPANVGPGPANPHAKAQVLQLVAQSRQALAQGNFAAAEHLARQAEQLRVPDTAYGPRDDRPSLVLYDINKARRANQASRIGVNAPAGNVQQAQGRGPGQLPAPAGQGRRLFDRAEQALQAGQIDQARTLFQQAARFQNELDAETRGKLQRRLQHLGPGERALGAAAQQQKLRRAQARAKLADTIRQARNLQQADPKRSLMLLEQARGGLQQEGLDPESLAQLMRQVDGEIEQMRRYVAENGPRIDLQQRNQAVRDELAAERQHKVEVDEKLAYLVDEYNRYIDQRRFAEAERVALKATEVAPESQLALQLRRMSRLMRSIGENQMRLDEKERGVMLAFNAVEDSGIPFDDNDPLQWPDIGTWKDLRERRGAFSVDRRRSAKELEIEQKLRTPVSLRFHEAPLAEVMDFLARLAQVNLHLDPQGLSEEHVSSDTPVTIDLTEDISLKSALNLILQPLHLNYVIKDEVLKITSEQLRDGDTYATTYNVADLVIPIPNFVPSVNMGMNGMLNEAYRTAGHYAGLGMHAPLTVAASPTGGTSNAMVDPAVLANVGSMSSMPGMPGPPQTPEGGPGGLGGGTQPDFDSLIELITTTVAPQTWEEVGGPGTIARYENNLSLVVSQTQEVHEQIADLLAQLRRLQDLQVTIEVRFVTLNDNFFERIGVDFDFDIDDDTDKPFQTFGVQDRDAAPTSQTDPSGQTDLDHPRNFQDRDHGRSATVGLRAPGMFTADLDIPVQQGSFPLAVPQFGGFMPGAGAQVGFAILSDLEAFFFIEASQGDQRTNVLQAPKVTLFNGQQATIQDTSQSPFVISVIPVVGDFAAAQQPVIVILNEGTFLNVQAVVSSDRRFVRLTVVPFFSTIGEVNTFTFTGAETTTFESGAADVEDEEPGELPRTVRSRQGTTVQLPTFSFISVATTVSVPDGGTVLLGGIKRLSEGRSEFGVPILDKIPYIDRLFRNSAIGRETQSLMMMVTPRIIIQEEEEQLLLGTGTQ